MEEALTTILAGVADGRRYWGRAPQKVKAIRKSPTDDDSYGGPGPYIILTRIDGIRDYVMQGPSGYVASRVQVDCYADTYTDAKASGRAVMATVSGYRSGIILGIFVDSERDLPAVDAGEVNHLFRVSIDLMIHHQEN